jgi:hypothetical protein
MSAHERSRELPVRSTLLFRAAFVAALFSAALAYASIPSRVVELVSHDPLHRWDDFGIFFSTAVCLSNSNCEPYPVPPRPFPNLNPPHFHWLVMPLVGVDVETAFRLWLLISAAAVAVSAVRTLRSLGITIRPLAAAAGTLAVLLSSVGWGTIGHGQVYPLLMWPVTEAWLAARSSRWHRAAGLLALGATVKPLLLLPLAWLGWQRPRTLATAAAVVLLVFGIGASVFGVEAYRGWYRHLGMAGPSGHWSDGSISSLLAHTFTRTPWLEPIIVAPFLVWPAWAGLSVLLLVDIQRWTPRASIDARWLGVLAAALLISPRGWVSTAWLLMGPAMAVALRARWRAPEMLLAAALLMLPVTVTQAGQPNSVLTLLNGSIYTWTWGLLYLAARSADRPSQERVLATKREAPGTIVS